MKTNRLSQRQGLATKAWSQSDGEFLQSGVENGEFRSHLHSTGAWVAYSATEPNIGSKMTMRRLQWRIQDIYSGWGHPAGGSRLGRTAPVRQKIIFAGRKSAYFCALHYIHSTTQHNNKSDLAEPSEARST